MPGRKDLEGYYIEANVNNHGGYDSFDAGVSIETFRTSNIAILAILIVATVTVSLSIIFEVSRQFLRKRLVSISVTRENGRVNDHMS